MDILKHGAEVNVIAPPSLQILVKKEIEKMKKIITPSPTEVVKLDNIQHHTKAQ